MENCFIEADQENFSKLTRTIIQQVDIIKDMVDEFSGYAGNAPVQRKQKLDLDHIIKDVIELFSEIKKILIPYVIILPKTKSIFLVVMHLYQGC